MPGSGANCAGRGSGGRRGGGAGRGSGAACLAGEGRSLPAGEGCGVVRRRRSDSSIIRSISILWSWLLFIVVGASSGTAVHRSRGKVTRCLTIPQDVAAVANWLASLSREPRGTASARAVHHPVRGMANYPPSIVPSHFLRREVVTRRRGYFDDDQERNLL